MGDENRFFRFLWRCNAILLATVGVAAVVAIAVAASQSLWGRKNWEPPPTGGFAPVPGKAEQDFTYRLEGSGSIAIGREQILALKRWKGAPSSYGLHDEMVLAKSSVSYLPLDNTVNLLAIDDAGKSHWLFQGYKRLIISQAEIRSGSAVTFPDTRPAYAVVLTVVDVDTNNDGELTDKDKKAVYIYRAGDAAAQKLLTVDEIRLNEQSGPDRYLITSETGKSATTTIFSLPDFRVLGTQPVPNVPQ